jgi:RNA polymerase sigma-70 factor (ECF subfamily)
LSVSCSDEELMGRCVRGEKAAFEEIAARYRPRLAAMARRWLGSSDSADEAAQDVLVSAFQRQRQYRHAGPFAGWLFALAANHLRDLERARRRRRRALGTLRGSALQTGPEKHVVDASVLWDALGGLPPRQRAALLLHDLYGFDHDEIAHLSGVPAGTARSRTSRARKEVRRRLEASGFTGRRRRQ